MPIVWIGCCSFRGLHKRVRSAIVMPTAAATAFFGSLLWHVLFLVVGTMNMLLLSLHLSYFPPFCFLHRWYSRNCQESILLFTYSYGLRNVWCPLGRLLPRLVGLACAQRACSFKPSCLVSTCYDYIILSVGYKCYCGRGRVCS